MKRCSNSEGDGEHSMPAESAIHAGTPSALVQTAMTLVQGTVVRRGFAPFGAASGMQGRDDSWNGTQVFFVHQKLEDRLARRGEHQVGHESTIMFHPHIHCLVTAGGLTQNGEFLHSLQKT